VSAAVPAVEREPRTVRDRPVVVGIGGTLRAGSSTSRALEHALAAAEHAGAEVVLLGAEALQLPLYDPAGPENAAAERLLAEIRRADGLIVASPGYHGGPSGVVKNALDYLEELRTDERPYLDGRAVGVVVCAAGWQATITTLASLRSIVHALRGWPTPLGVAINSMEAPFGEDGRPCERVAAQLATVGQQVVEFANRGEARPRRPLAERVDGRRGVEDVARVERRGA
jgi:FMN reductase